MPMSRRDVLKAGAAAGALLLGQPLGALADALGPTREFATSRASRLFPGTRLAHADLHNHTLFSDGAGDPAEAFASMRDAGLDVAALTDHSTVAWGTFSQVDPCTVAQVFTGDPHEGDRDPCRSLVGLDEAGWERTAELADDADAPGEFTAIRGFEWSSPILGHVNVWFSERWIDPLHTAGIGPEGLGQYAREIPGLGEPLGGALDGVLRANPAKGSGMAAFYRWLQADPSTPVIGGGGDGIAGFNHPGREPGRFGYFAPDPAVRDRIVSMEILNRREDYLFEGYRDGQPSPLVECLDAGWRVGLLGVTDEHGTDWGHPDGKGRAGLWVTDLSRDGVREALLARRFFATFLRGLRLDAAATGLADGPGPAPRVRMGSTLPHRSGPVTFEVDIDRGPEWWGKPLQVQVLRSGDGVPEVVHVEDVEVPTDRGPIIRFSVPLDVDEGRWVVLRIADPEAVNGAPGPDGHAGNVGVVAYASPFYLEP
jgi:hypothetical protein